MALTELRIYELFDGKMDDWVAYMNEVIVPYQTELGMRITAQYRSTEDDKTFVWTRVFEDKADYDVLCKKVYGSERWKTEMGPMARSMINVETMRVEMLVGI